MKKVITIFCLICLSKFLLFSQAPEIEWQKSFGGSSADYGRSICHTPDSGYLLVGETYSNDGDVDDFNGDSDAWVIRLDSSGNVEWKKCFGGWSVDKGWPVTQTYDLNYVICGEANSENGEASCGGYQHELWIFKINDNGDTLWSKCYGGLSVESGYSIQETNDSCIIVAGIAASSGGDVHGNNGIQDFWILKLDRFGDTLWTKCLGGEDNEFCYSIQETFDHGYIVTGNTRSTAGYVHGNHGKADIWLVKLNSTGDTLWTRCIGGSEDELAYSVIQTADSCFVIAGYTLSNDGDISDSDGEYNMLIAKLDTDGIIKWLKCYGDYTGAETILEIENSGFLVAGNTQDEFGHSDIWLVRLDPMGDTLWTKCFGGSLGETPWSLLQTKDNGYIILGSSYSDDGDVTTNNGNSDYWVIKLNAPPCEPKYFFNELFLCEGDSVFLEGAYQTIAGTYYDTTLSYQGCDSVIVTNLTVSSCTGITFDNFDDEITIFSVPTNGIVYIQGGNIDYYELYNMSGTLLLRSDNKMINFTKYTKGSYIVRITEKNRNIVIRKVIYQ